MPQFPERASVFVLYIAVPPAYLAWFIKTMLHESARWVHTYAGLTPNSFAICFIVMPDLRNS